ncbi:hypothetical protein ACF0H5_013735 [Mactra antiquata]
MTFRNSSQLGAQMSKSLQMAKVFVASVDSRLGHAVKKLLPATDVISIQRSTDGKMSEVNKQQIENDAEILFADVPVIIDVAYSAKKLKWAASTWAGVEKLISGLDESKKPPFVVTRMGGAFNRIMAEYVLGYILTKERFIIQLSQLQDKGTWDMSQYRKYRSIEGLVIGILGLGEIGLEVARLCNAVGMKVIGVTRSVKSDDKKVPYVSEYRTTTDIPIVLEQCDYICNILPSTCNTRGLLSGDILSHCKNKKTIFINIGRGDIIDEDSLVKAISECWIGGAVLDVFNNEPLSEESPLWKLPNVIITPHIAGVSLTDQIAASFVKNYELYSQNKPLQFVVDFKRGY